VRHVIPTMILLGLLVVSIIFIAAIYPPSTSHTVAIQWLDGRHTTVRVDDISTDNGFLSLHVIDEPVGWMIIPAFSIHWIVAVESLSDPNDAKTLGFPYTYSRDLDFTDFVRP